MIFVTTGTQLPFPRLVAAMNGLAPSLGEEVIAQVGPDPAPYPNLSLAPHLTPSEFEARFAAARIVVAHAGIGTILSAKRLGRPLVLVPRRHAMGEHRNDHQLATARGVEGRTGIHIAWDVADLPGLLAQDLAPAEDSPGAAHGALTGFLRAHIAALRGPT